MHRPRVEAFRHRAAFIIADHTEAAQCFRGLTLTPYVSVEQATKVMRHGLWPILNGARVADKPTRASFAVMSASL